VCDINAPNTTWQTELSIHFHHLLEEHVDSTIPDISEQSSAYWSSFDDDGAEENGVKNKNWKRF
jgi:hypothetical protein